MDNCVAVVQQQLDFYNRKDIDGWLSTYAKDARQFNLHGEQIAYGHEEMRRRIAIRFAEPDLHAQLLSRIVMGHVVVDHELITRNFPEGKGQVEMLCIYEVKQGLISTASFSVSKPTLFAAELAKG